MTTISIPKEFIEPAVKEVEDLIGVDCIGEVHMVGDWNNWGDSPKKAGCINPIPETQMQLVEGKYVIELDLSSGIYEFKPVVIKASRDNDGMAPAVWISCPGETGGFRPGKHGNWKIIVK